MGTAVHERQSLVVLLRPGKEQRVEERGLEVDGFVVEYEEEYE